MAKKSKGNSKTNNMVGKRNEKPALPKADRSIGTAGKPYVKGSRAPGSC